MWAPPKRDAHKGALKLGRSEAVIFCRRSVTGTAQGTTGIWSYQVSHWVKARHSTMSASSLLHPDKRTLIIDFRTSALGQKQTSAASFDHLAGERKRKRWNLEAEYLGRLEIEVEKELRWSHDWQDRRICAIENQTCVSSA
jgi:hypothetical protein